MNGFYPDNEFLTTWRALDDYHRKLADIKLIPASPDDIQFKAPDIRPAPEMPIGTMFMIPERRPGETEEEWGARCVIITNIGDPDADRRHSGPESRRRNIAG